MDRECLNRRIGNASKLKKGIGCWEKDRNNAKKKIYWSFTREKIDEKLSKHYVA
jgi:hypothetical protein